MGVLPKASTRFAYPLQAEISAQRIRVLNVARAFYKQYHTTPEELTRSIQENLAATREKLEKTIKTLKHAHNMATLAGEDAEKIKALQEALERINMAINALHGLIAATSKNPVKQLVTVQDSLNIAASLLEETMPGVGTVLSAYATVIDAVGGAIERGLVAPLNDRALHALLKPYKVPGGLTIAVTPGSGAYSESGVVKTIRNALENRNLLRQHPGLKKILERALAQFETALWPKYPR